MHQKKYAPIRRSKIFHTRKANYKPEGGGGGALGARRCPNAIENTNNGVSMTGAVGFVIELRLFQP